MNLNHAEHISLRNFLNAFFRENHAEINDENNQIYIKYILKPFNFELRIPLQYSSITGRHQFNYPAQLYTHNQAAPQPLHPWCLIGLLMQDLSVRHPHAASGHREFMHRFYNSCENLQLILDKLSSEQINRLFSIHVDFESAENGLITGHQMHPAPKSREGFTRDEFLRYSPELKNHFQLHYFLADPNIVFSQSELPFDANELVRQYFLIEAENKEGTLIPIHPWQANYLRQLPSIQRLIKNGDLIDLGARGHAFTATTSIRSVYCQQSPFMAKLSLNVMITNSMRMQYSKELTRGIAAHRFWHTPIGNKIQAHFPYFKPITDPTFLCLKDGDTLIQETAVLFRTNPFTVFANNATPVATLCQDHPLEQKNRFSNLIPFVAKKHQISHAQAALMWFEEFLKVAVEPLLWMFVHHGIAIEAHQQNMLIELEDGLPVKSYYRDNQGYYVVDSAIPALSAQVDISILNEFCKGTIEFITHHFIYYLICNSVFGIINALGTSGMIGEATLIKVLADFIAKRHVNWQESNYILPELLEKETLPFKGNLLTRFYELDELIAPLEQQSVYVNIDNIIKRAHNMN